MLYAYRKLIVCDNLYCTKREVFPQRIFDFYTAAAVESDVTASSVFCKNLFAPGNAVFMLVYRMQAKILCGFLVKFVSRCIKKSTRM